MDKSFHRFRPIMRTVHLYPAPCLRTYNIGSLASALEKIRCDSINLSMGSCLLSIVIADRLNSGARPTTQEFSLPCQRGICSGIVFTCQTRRLRPAFTLVCPKGWTLFPRGNVHPFVHPQTPGGQLHPGDQSSPPKGKIQKRPLGLWVVNV
jgi:hypothetical protein